MATGSVDSPDSCTIKRVVVAEPRLKTRLELLSELEELKEKSIHLSNKEFEKRKNEILEGLRKDNDRQHAITSLLSTNNNNKDLAYDSLYLFKG